MILSTSSDKTINPIENKIMGFIVLYFKILNRTELKKGSFLNSVKGQIEELTK